MPGEDQFRRPGQGGARLIAGNDLLTRLGRAAEGKVAIISAPVGRGKSSPLRARAGRVSRPVRLAVVRVNRDQRDARDFWLTLLDADGDITLVIDDLHELRPPEALVGPSRLLANPEAQDHHP